MRIFKIGGIGEKSALCITILIDNLIYPLSNKVSIIYMCILKNVDRSSMIILQSWFFFYWTDQFKVFLKQVLNELAFIVSTVNLLAC